MAEVPEWAPETTAVVPHLRRYAEDANGNRLEDFSDDGMTAIHRADVSRAIGSVARDVLGLGPVPEPLHDMAADVVALGAAAEAVVDLSPELHRDLQNLYTDRLANLQTAIQDKRDGTADGSATPPSTWCGPAAFDVTRAAF